MKNNNNRDHQEFIPPETAEEADDRRLRLIQDADEIQQQLQFTNLEEFGDEQAYLRWRRAAHLAMSRKRGEARWLRTWKARRLNSVAWTRSEDGDLTFANQLLKETFDHFTKANLSESERQLMNKIRKHLVRQGVVDS